MQLRTHIGHHHGLGPLQGAEGEPGAKGKGKPEPGKGGEEEEGGFHERGARESELISRVGLWADVALTGAKGAAGWLSGSTAILADAAHSVSDIVKIPSPPPLLTRYQGRSCTRGQCGMPSDAVRTAPFLVAVRTAAHDIPHCPSCRLTPSTS